ncbi:MBL fold metallo-hydrolase [Silvibacterium dinghuense]|uniref:MBL fold metallo-hydrolase n=1 Tax=Silvibacterium dinghuense TaxID=1560006 RepID=A0A4Q1SCE5_9BACT|nr:MBL fold metallo-hydrolase [Silvibacterium dinghuense]
MTGIPMQQAPTVYRRKLGDTVITLLNDGFEDYSFDIVHHITRPEAEHLLRAAGLPPIARMPVHAFLIQDGRHTTLVDSGDANCMGTGGYLLSALRVAGVAPAEIDTVLVTHAHTDHIGGLLAPDGARVFPRAEVVLHEEEFRFWSDDANFGPERQRMLPVRALALRVFEIYRSSLRTVTGGEVLPGIVLEPLPGHTPGHSGYRVTSKGESVLIWGDIVHLADIQIPRPEATLVFDVDAPLAEATRRRVLERAASENLLIAGMHLQFPGFLRIVRDDSSFALRPERWSPALD